MGARLIHHALIAKTHTKYIPSGAAIPPTIPLPEFSGPVSVSMPSTVPALATIPTTASHADHRGKTSDPKVNTAMRQRTLRRRKRRGSEQERRGVQCIGAGRVSVDE